MSTFVVVEFAQPDRAEIAYHVVPLKNPGEKGFYNEVRSWTAFMNLSFPDRRRTRTQQFFVRRLEEHEISETAWKHTCALTGMEYSPVPIVQHTSVDAFYAAIGYDKRTKRITPSA